jgi:small subunit ribosomal protein S15
MLTKEKKEKIIKEYQKNEKDTGSCEVQIALISERISQISGHLKLFPKDKHSLRGLMKLIGRRKAFMKYLKKNDQERYELVSKKVLERNKK